MNKCENCGREFGGNFCPECGTKAAQQAFKNETRIDVAYSVKISENILGKKLKVLMLIGGIFLILVGAVWLTLELVLPGPWEPELVPPIVCLALGLFVGIFALAFKPIIRYLTLKNMVGKESTNFYTFTEEGYEVVTKMSDGTESKATGNYNSFIEAKEYADMWLLYINKATVFSVAKGGMTEGTAEELSALLTCTTGTRYKVCYKK